MKIDEFDNKKLKALLSLMRRVSKCRYRSVVMVNRVILQCYSIDNDSDIGMHYTMFIPDIDLYDSPVYNIPMELVPSELLKTYTAGHKILLDIKKERSLRPKDINETLFISTVENDTMLEFRFQYIIDDIVNHTAIYKVPYPLDLSRPDVENCPATLDNLASRIKIGGYCMQIDALRIGLFQRVLDSSDIYYHIVKMNGTKIRIPLMKSMFLGAKKYDSFIITLQESTIPGIYILCMLFTRDNISECFYGYIQNY